MHDHEQDILVGSDVIVPKQHRTTTFDLTPTEWSDTYTLIRDAKAFLEKTHGPDGYTLGRNVVTASHQTVPHAHLHIIPRYAEDPYASKDYITG